MIALGIGIVLGLAVLVMGLALLEQERKDRKQVADKREQSIGESQDREALVNAIVDREQPQAFVDLRRAKLGAFLLTQGVLLVLICIALIIVNRFLVVINWYISVPVIVVLLLVFLFTDAFMMGGKIAEDALPETEEIEQEVEECTEKEQDNAAETEEEEA